MKKKVLYLGDSPAGGPANYLLGILRKSGVTTTHFPPSEALPERLLKKEKFDGVILSDYSYEKLSKSAEDGLFCQINAGAGLLMVGGWGSFSGPFGGWKNSRVAELLPVKCSSKDDRTNFPGGASLKAVRNHELLEGLSFDPAPAICGMNRVQPKEESETILSVRKILSDGSRIRFEPGEYPLLVIGRNPRIHAAALATDLAPHWCGGLVDWGTRLVTLPVVPGIQIQVGDQYIRFVTSLICWLVKTP